jgi:hypothetical protein
MKSSIVRSVGKIGSGEGKYGQYFMMKVQFDNGDAGTIFENKTDRRLLQLNEGVEVVYDIESNAKGNNIKIKEIRGIGDRAPSGNGQAQADKFQMSDNQKIIVRQTAFKGAIDIAANVNLGIENEEQMNALVQRLTDKFFELILKDPIYEETIQAIKEV